MEILNSAGIYFDRAIDFLQSHNGRIKLRNSIVPVFIVGGIVMVAIGSTWAHLLKPECGLNYDSAKFSITTDASTGERILSGNSCPGYDWSSQKSFNTAGQYDFVYAVSTEPRISKKPIYVGESNPISGPIGVALNGVPIFSPSISRGNDAIKSQHKLFDECGGLNAPFNDFAFNAPITGYYNYLNLPGVRDISSSKTVFCPDSYLWYNESHNQHSPLAGFMADGIPIYGPLGKKGKLPMDLDECGGHSSDDFNFYHYHFQTKYPYSVNCLQGCADGAMNSQIKSGVCSIDDTVSYDYTPLLSFSTSYGGSGQNETNITGPACLLTFGILVFIISSICCGCIYCKNIPTEKVLHAKLPMANNEEFGYVDSDNIL